MVQGGREEVDSLYAGVICCWEESPLAADPPVCLRGIVQVPILLSADDVPEEDLLVLVSDTFP